MRTTHFLALATLALALAACTEAPESDTAAADAAPPVDAPALVEKPRLTVPTESVGKGYKPAEIKLNTPPENGTRGGG